MKNTTTSEGMKKFKKIKSKLLSPKYRQHKPLLTINLGV